MSVWGMLGYACSFAVNCAYEIGYGKVEGYTPRVRYAHLVDMTHRRVNCKAKPCVVELV